MYSIMTRLFLVFTSQEMKRYETSKLKEVNDALCIYQHWGARRLFVAIKLWKYIKGMQLPI